MFELSSYFYQIQIFFRFWFPLIILIFIMFGIIWNRETFEKANLNRYVIIFLLVGGLIGSFINLPVYSNESMSLFINAGGILIPILISCYFIYKTCKDVIFTFSTILLVVPVTYIFARFESGYGIIIEFPYYFFPMLFGTLFPFIFFHNQRDRIRKIIPISYSSTTIGIFIGSDILLLPVLLDSNIRVGYLGGLGIFDLIFISGLYSIAFSYFSIRTL